MRHSISRPICNRIRKRHIWHRNTPYLLVIGSGRNGPFTFDLYMIRLLWSIARKQISFPILWLSSAPSNSTMQVFISIRREKNTYIQCRRVAKKNSRSRSLWNSRKQTRIHHDIKSPPPPLSLHEYSQIPVAVLNALVGVRRMPAGPDYIHSTT